MNIYTTIAQYFMGFILLLSSVGILIAKKPVHAALCFLSALLMLAALYLELLAQFISVMQILVYAGAILVIFVFVIVLFQDAHQHIHDFQPRSSRWLLGSAAVFFVVVMLLLGRHFLHLPNTSTTLPAEFGTVQEIGKSLYLKFFFPFEAITLLFIVASIGALYIAKKEN